MISEFELWLRSRTSKEKRPFHEETILANVSAITLFGSGDDHATPVQAAMSIWALRRSKLARP
jgi:hypothetical protein